MNFKKVMAGILAATMIVGSSMMAFAANQTGGITGEGSSAGHVDKEVLTVTLPTEAADSNLATTFNYIIDPERVIDLAEGQLTDGTTTVAPNDDGVYFKNMSDDGTTVAGYSSSSDAVEFEGKNSVAVDVSVAAEIEATAGDTDIALAADDAALTAAETPTLLLKLTVGTDTKVITSEGATAKASIAGKPNNFGVKVIDNVYKYVVKDTPTEAWDKTTVQLSGKTNQMDVPADMTAPKVKLTWTVEKHMDSYLSATTITAVSNSVTVTLPEDVTISKVELTKTDGTGVVQLTNGNQYTLNETMFTISGSLVTAWVGSDYTKVVLTFSDDKTETITLQ